MLQISKKVEYALIAIRHMALQPRGAVTTAKEIAERYGLPYDLLAKVLQRLVREAVVASHQGVHGGYTLLRNPNEIHLSEVFAAVEGKPSLAITQCEAESPENCSIHSTCTIKDPLARIQSDINRMFAEMTVSEFV